MSNPVHDPKVAWVNHHPQDTDDPAVRAAYDAVTGPDGRVENLYLAMSLTPGAIGPADAHYRDVLHGTDCGLEKWLRECIATHVAIICGCAYAEANHGENFEVLYGDRKASGRLLASLKNGTWRDDLHDPRLLAITEFTELLSLRPEAVGEENIMRLRAVGLSDKDISYIVQIAASFAYWSRTINGLGIQLGEGKRGFY